MGQLIDKKIVQSRIYHDPRTTTIPSYNYDYTYPITVYDAVKRNFSSESTTLTDEIDSIYRLIADKQNIVEPGIAGHLMSWTGVKGQIGDIEIVKEINSDPIARSHRKVPSERAVGMDLDKKVSKSDYQSHVTDNHIHISESERIKWNSAPSATTVQNHVSNDSIHVTPEDKLNWNNKAEQVEFEDHIFDVNNPHNVTAHQAGTYSRQEIDDMFVSIRESFFNYKNIQYDDRTNTAKLVEYNAAFWNPNYILAYGDEIPDVTDPTLTYFALKPVTDYSTNETQECLIYLKKPGLGWQEVGIQTLTAGDLVIRYPDTTLCVWVQGRFIALFTDSSPVGGTGTELGESTIMWRPVVDVEGILSWTKSSESAAPDPVTIKGPPGYTPIKGVDYDDGADGLGIPTGGRPYDILIKTDYQDYETDWMSFIDILADAIEKGVKLPDGIICWDMIDGKPVIYNKLGYDETGLITQSAVTIEFDKLSTKIEDIITQMNANGGITAVQQLITEHMNDFYNPHRVTADAIGATPISIFTAHIQDYENPHAVTADQIGLGLVNNTSDLDKPISTATQRALDTLNVKLRNISDDISNNNFVANVSWADTTCSLTFTYRDGSELLATIPILEVFESLYYDNVNHELVLIMPDRNEHRISIRELITTYLGHVSNNINVEIDENVIKATILPDSVTGMEIINSVRLMGSPTTTTQIVSDRSTRIATTEFVKSIVIDNLISYETDRPLSANMGRILNKSKADIADILQILADMDGYEVVDHLDSTNQLAALSANMGRYLDLIKAPRVHTSPSGATYGRASVDLFGHVRATDIDPLMDGVVFVGTDDGKYARADHRHPWDVTRAPMNWPDRINGQYQFTGEPRSSLPPDDDNSNWIATTEWVRRVAVGCMFGKCSTEENQSTKIIELESSFMDDAVFIRQKGSTIVVTFTEDDNVNGTTLLNVQGTGEAPLKYQGLDTVPGMIKARCTYMFTYDGLYWVLQNPTGIHTLPDSDISNAFVSSEWVRRNAVGCMYGVSITPGDEIDKVATLSSSFMDPVFFLRQIGSMVAITFLNEDRSGHEKPTTLNVQDTGAAEILYGGFFVNNGMLGKNHTHIFVFDGVYWRLINPVAGTGIAGDKEPEVDQWTDDGGNVFKVTFNAQGGDVPIPYANTNTSGYLVDPLPIPSKIGYMFGGWYRDEACESDVMDIKFKYTCDTILYAKWNIITGNEYVVSFNAMGGSVTPDNVVVEIGRSISYLPTPYRAGYEFAGWYTTPLVDGYHVTTTTMLMKDILVFARWEIPEGSVINKFSGYQCITVKGDGEINEHGEVNHVYVILRYEERQNDVRIDVSQGTNHFAVLTSMGTQFVVHSPQVISANRDNAIIQFQMEQSYPSNQQVQLMYTMTTAFINIIEIDELGNDIGCNPIQRVPIFETKSLPSGKVGEVYNEMLIVTGETPIVFRMYSGNLPDGLTLSDHGIIHGEPTSVGRYPFTIQAINGSGVTLCDFIIVIDYADVI